MNLKPEELAKALRCCVFGAPCQNCPEVGNDNCMDDVHVFAAELIERDQKEIEALRAKLPKWISVKERLPIDRLKKYLVAFRDAGGSIVDMARYFPSDGWTCDNWDVPQNLITHWMPLPEPPKEAE